MSYLNLWRQRQAVSIPVKIAVDLDSSLIAFIKSIGLSGMTVQPNSNITLFPNTILNTVFVLPYAGSLECFRMETVVTDRCHKGIELSFLDQDPQTFRRLFRALHSMGAIQCVDESESQLLEHSRKPHTPPRHT